MKRILLLTITLFYYSHLAAQLMPIDSLQFAFKRATTDTAKLSILFKDNPFQYLGKADLMLDLYSQGYALAQRLNDKTNIYKAQFYTAMIYIYDKSDEGTGFQWLQKALVAAEAEQNNRSIQSVYYAIGIIYNHQGNSEEMYKAFYKSVAYGEQSSDPHNGVFAALSQCLYNDKRWEEYLDINKKWVALMEKVNAPPANKLNAYNSLADALSKFPDRKQEREYYFAKANSLLDNITDLGNDADKLLIAASIYYKFNRQKEAIIYANKVLNLKNNDGFTLSNKGLAHKFLADIYENQQNYPLSNIHLKAYQKFEIEQMQKRLTDDAGRKVIKAESERDLYLKQNEVDKNRWITLFASSISILLLLGSIIVYRFYKREQERKQELSALNTTKDRLFAILSHDLMSPIGTLKNYLSLMDWGVMNQEQFSQSSERLKIKVNNLYNLLENVLHWSITQMQGIKPKVETVNINEVVSEQIALLSSIAETKGIALTQAIESDATIQADKNHLGLIVRNLLQNALKFTPKGGTIHFSLEDTEGGQKLTIQDTGIGIPNETLDKLFKIEQNTNREGTAQEGGTGLGLILTKELVELNGGTINVSSEVGKGTQFVLSFT